MDNANDRVIVQQGLTAYLNKSKAVISRREGKEGTLLLGLRRDLGRPAS